MPRSGAGVYSLPAGNPVVTLTAISSTWGNTTMSDIASALTGSVAANGVTSMTGALKGFDGAVGTPGYSWANETTSGWYRLGLNQFGFSVAGVLSLSVDANRSWVISAPIGGTSFTAVGAANNYAAEFLGSVTAGQSFGLSIKAGSSAADTALRIQNRAATATYFTMDGLGTIHFSSAGTAVSASTITITGPASSNRALSIQSNTTPGASLGFNMNAGMDATDQAFVMRNAINTLDLMKLQGDGSLIVGNAVSGGGQGPGTINCAGIFVNGVAH